MRREAIIVYFSLHRADRHVLPNNENSKLEFHPMAQSSRSKPQVVDKHYNQK